MTTNYNNSINRSAHLEAGRRDEAAARGQSDLFLNSRDASVRPVEADAPVTRMQRIAAARALNLPVEAISDAAVRNFLAK